ncbi:type VI secretion system baseplate subunit TssE [Aquabacter cavernae]|uniref:type VI secretion system baseplate subunit TssE n=1 Tax=Aquabacter cavernae TaxID=2496029 RepID=UPI000F8E126D|nr:type VI secretion system baseplate subunit TssE [Aquabacter cavernae]
MANRTLMERLTAPERLPTEHLDPEIVRKSDAVDVMTSVLGNLRHVLNSRAACCQSRPDFGMPDFNDLAGKFPDALAIIASAVREQIEKFEPRLSQVTVRHVPDRSNPLRLAFRIHATLNLEEGGQRLSFDTVLNNNGFVNVSD